MSKFPIASPYEFERLSKEDPALLVDWVNSGRMSNSDLTFAAESLGNFPAGFPILYELLNHSSPMVREGAIYGLVTIRESIDERIKLLADNDPSPGVRESAKDHSR